jgi:hypothetical protein
MGTAVVQSLRRLGYRLDYTPTFNSRQGQMVGIFSLHHLVHIGSGAHPASSPMSIGGCFPRGKADLSPPSSAEVNGVWPYLYSPIRLHGVVLV